MKALNLKSISQIALLFSSLFLMACGGGSDGGKVATGGPTGSPNGNSGFVTQNLETIIQQVDSSLGKRTAYFSQNNFSQPQNIDSQISQFLFPNSQPSYQISGVSSIAVNIDMGNINSYDVINSQSLSQNSSQIQMYLRIDDSFSVNGQDDPIFTGFGRGTLQVAQMNGNRLELHFGDNFGTFKIVSENGQVTISFINSGQAEQVLATGFGNI